jgi:hypothetical protein
MCKQLAARRDLMFVGYGAYKKKLLQRAISIQLNFKLRLLPHFSARSHYQQPV